VTSNMLHGLEIKSVRRSYSEIKSAPLPPGPAPGSPGSACLVRDECLHCSAGPIVVVAGGNIRRPNLFCIQSREQIKTLRCRPISGREHARESDNCYDKSCRKSIVGSDTHAASTGQPFCSRGTG